MAGLSDELSRPGYLFWPISREIVRDRERNTTELRRLRSLITYQLLFGGRLVIRDSDYINTLAFRNSVLATLNDDADDDAWFLRTIFDDGLVVIARRRGVPLSKLAETMRHSGRSPIIDSALFRPEAADLVYLDEDLTTVPRDITYSLEHAQTFYTAQVGRMLDRPLDPYLDEPFRLRAVARVAEHLAEHRVLGWEFFAQDRGGFWDAFTEEEHHQHGRFVDFILAQAPHTAFIPHMLGYNPIYMHDVAEGIDVWRGRHNRDRELIEKRTFRMGSTFSLSDYVDYLAILPANAIDDLMSGDENAAFRDTCERFATQRATAWEVEVAYMAYRTAIDAALRHQYSALPANSGAETWQAFKWQAKDEAMQEGVEFAMEQGIGAVVPFWQLIYSTFCWVAGVESPKQRADRAVRQATDSNYAAEVQRLQNFGQRYSAKVLADSPGAIDRQVHEEEPRLCADLCVTGG